MIIIPPPRRKTRRPAQQEPVAPPSEPNAIVDWSNPSGGPDNQLQVTVRGTVLAVDVGGFEGHQNDDGWYPIVGVDLSEPPLVKFIFSRDMTGSDLWRVPDPSKWTFADGRPLEEPWEGSFI